MNHSAKMPKLKMDHFRMLIGGALVESESRRWFPSINPANEEVLAQVPLGSAKDVDRAVEAAEKAQPAWASLPVAKRSEYLRMLAGALNERAEELLYLEVLDTGNTISKMENDVASGIAHLLYFAGLGYELKGCTIPSTPGNLHLTIREPYGVVGRIVPFNHPIMFAISKMGPPLIAGNTMVIKPSQQTSLSTCVLGEICQQVLPPGVVNIVTGFGDEVGEAIVRHPRVKRLALIGSVKTGMAIQRSAAEVAVKHITLELGGKNPMIVFSDADLSAAIPAAVDGMNFAWQGQSCGSTSRLLLHDSIYDQVLQGVVKIASSIRLDDPLSWSAQMGPINNKVQYEKVKYYTQAGKEDGAKLMTGGRRPGGREFERGYWFEPTIFADVKPEMRIAREEIFGPVLSVMRWKSLVELQEVASSVDVGLTGSVWTRDVSTAIKTARWIQSGYIWINGVSAHYPATPFGGYKNSGIGREEGYGELLSYTEEKTIHIVL
jgi:acyl-CoA reductase-like NAD-dependent aldehyde dehydrogenase